MIPAHHQLIGNICARGGSSIAAAVEAGLVSADIVDPDAADFWSLAIEEWSKGRADDPYQVMANVIQHPKSPYRQAHEMILSLMGGEGAFTNVLNIVDDVQTDGKAHRISSVASQMLRDVQQSPHKAVESIGGHIESLTGLGRVDGAEMTLVEGGEEAIQWSMNPTKRDGIRLPFRTLTSQCGRITDEVCWLMAGPSVGKTALALAWACDAVEFDQAEIHYIGLEDGGKPRKLINRMLMRLLGKPTDRMTVQEADQCRRYLEMLQACGLTLTSKPNSIEKIRAYCTMLSRRLDAEAKDGTRKKAMVFVDNLRHVRTGKNYDGEMQRFMALSLEFKHIRDDTGIPIVILHHTNEEGKTGWSRDIDKDSDMTIKLSRSQEESIQSGDGQPRLDHVIVNVEKCRDGDTPKIGVHFHPAQMRFDEFCGKPVP